MKQKIHSEDNFITLKPNSERISRYISYYYFHSSDDENYNKSFVFYPNNKHALTVYKSSEVKLDSSQSKINPSTKLNLNPIYSINKDKSIKVNINGCFDKLGIVFNPLGINFFIDKPLNEIFTKDFNFFQHFGDKFKEVLAEIFSEKDFQIKASLLDDFFEKQFIEFDEPILKRSVKEIIKSNGGIKVAELSEILDVNRKTLLRLFKKHTNMSVEEYRKMVMFRQAFNYFHQNKENNSLTDVALFSMYYDQAHFIKHFKSVTQETPTTLLSKISHLGKEDTYWYFED